MLTVGPADNYQAVHWTVAIATCCLLGATASALISLQETAVCVCVFGANYCRVAVSQAKANDDLSSQKEHARFSVEWPETKRKLQRFNSINSFHSIFREIQAATVLTSDETERTTHVRDLYLSQLSIVWSTVDFYWCWFWPHKKKFTSKDCHLMYDVILIGNCLEVFFSLDSQDLASTKKTISKACTLNVI